MAELPPAGMDRNGPPASTSHISADDPLPFVSDLQRLDAMASAPIFVVDAFSDQPFAGNPAAVCVLQHEPSASWMRSVAAEMNLSETAFVRPCEGGFSLRWFTPTVEVDLCGHATLASAHVLWSEGMVSPGRAIDFETRSGRLCCVKADEHDVIELDFPALPAQRAMAPNDVLAALGVEPHYAGRSKFDRLIVVESQAIVEGLSPDFSRLKKDTMRGVIVTSPADSCDDPRAPQIDFVSRYFAPGFGVDEDPVTGSAHCCLATYWGPRLNQEQLTGYQASARGGIVKMRLVGDRVILGGRAVTVVKGTLI